MSEILPELWLRALQNIMSTLSHMANKSIKWKIPLQSINRIQPDIKAIII